MSRSRSSSAAVVVLILFGLLMATSNTVSALTCGETVRKLSHCFQYLSGRNGPTPPRECCDGVVGLNDALATKPDRQAACFCLKRFSTSMNNLNQGLVRNLPGRCNVHLNFAVTPSINCNL